MTMCSCVAEFWTKDAAETQRLKSLFRSILGNVDPHLNLLHFRTNPLIDHYMLAGKHTKYKSDLDKSESGLFTPSLAFVLFALENKSVPKAEDSFHSDSVSSFPQFSSELGWAFHHKIELSSASKKGGLHCVAKQEFYQPKLSKRSHRCSLNTAGNLNQSSENQWSVEGREKGTEANVVHALWAVCPIHYGNEHFRFTIFTNNLEKMASFYETLIFHDSRHNSLDDPHVKMIYSKNNFRLYRLQMLPGMDIQLALKNSNQLRPYAPQSSFLRFTVNNTSTLQQALRQKPQELCQKLSLVHDPDGNPVLIEDNSVERQLTDSRMRVWSLLQSLSHPGYTSDHVSGICRTKHTRSFSQPLDETPIEIYTCPSIYSNVAISGSSEDVRNISTAPVELKFDTRDPIQDNSRQSVSQDQYIHLGDENIIQTCPYRDNSESITDEEELCLSSATCWSDISSGSDSGILSYRDTNDDSQDPSSYTYSCSCCQSSNPYSFSTSCSCGSYADGMQTVQYQSKSNGSNTTGNTDSGQHIGQLQLPSAKQTLSDDDCGSQLSTISDYSTPSASTIKSSDLLSSEDDEQCTKSGKLFVSNSSRHTKTEVQRKQLDFTQESHRRPERKPWELDDFESEKWLSEQFSN